jgi:hypothetical protein
MTNYSQALKTTIQEEQIIKYTNDVSDQYINNDNNVTTV